MATWGFRIGVLAFAFVGLATEPAAAGQKKKKNDDGGAPSYPISMAGLTLVKGDGWTGPTTADGGGLNTPARWNFVPYQEITEPTPIGVVAFHASGIEHVRFAVEGGPWIEVTSMNYNPLVNAWEYWAVVDPAQWVGTKLVVVRAVAVPKQGKPRVLEDMPVWVDLADADEEPSVRVAPNGSDTSAAGPFKTLKKAAAYLASQQTLATSGGTIHCEPGTYWFSAPNGLDSLTRMDGRWLEITPAPGVDRDSVIVTQATVGGSWPVWNRAALRVDMVRLHGVRSERITYYAHPEDGTQSIWFDEHLYTWNDRYAANAPNVVEGFHKRYSTNSITIDAPNAMRNADLVSGDAIGRISDQAFFHCDAVLNTYVEDIDAGSTGWHTDVFHHEYGNVDNFIAFNVVATNCRAQGIYMDKANLSLVRSAAFVNVLIEHPIGGSQLHSFIASPTNNLLLRNVTILNQRFSVDVQKPHPNTVVEGCVFSSAGPMDGVQTSLAMSTYWITDCHFTSGATYGTRATSGNPMLAGNLRPLPHSPLVGRLVSSVDVDASGQIRPMLSSVGALEP